MSSASAASARASQLLRRFQLPASATKQQLRAAYLDKAKTLHPDVAGKSSEAAFRKIKDEYEEAMRLLREVELAKKAGPSVERESPEATMYRQHWQEWQAQAHRHETRWSHQTQQQAQSQQQADAQSAAHRVRNIMLVSGSVIATGAFLTTWSNQRPPVSPTYLAPQANLVRHSSGSSTASPRAGADTSDADDDGELPVESVLKRSSSQPLERKVSDYYQRRTTKSTVRRHASDTYVPSNGPVLTRSRTRESKQEPDASTTNNSSSSGLPVSSQGRSDSPLSVSGAGGASSEGAAGHSSSSNVTSGSAATSASAETTELATKPPASSTTI